MKTMSEFDPFSGGGNFNNYESKPKSKPNNLKPLLIKGIIIFIALAVIGIGIYYLFFNTANIDFIVNDTEGKSINSAQIKIKKEGTTKFTTIGTEEIIKLKKNTNYVYNITAQDFSSETNLKLTPTADETIETTLEKNIALQISSITCPSKVFLGQKVVCTINVENKSPSQDYNTDFFVFSGDVSNWADFKDKSYKFVDQYGDEISTARKTILPLRNEVYLVSFNIPTDKKLIGNKKINIRIKYKLEKKEASFEVADSPTVTFTSDISKIEKMISGEEKKAPYWVDNTKNNSEITDLILSIDANYTSEYDYNLDLTNAIIRDSINIGVNAKTKYPGQITLKIPANARAGQINGKLILNGTVFPEPETISFTINIEEPENKFLLSLSKSAEALVYDTNTSQSNEKIITIKVDNQNNLKVKLQNIVVENLSTNNCEKWITVPELYNNYDIQPKEKPEIPIILKANSTEISEIIGTKLCALKVNYINPFTDEEITKILNLTITVG